MLAPRTDVAAPPKFWRTVIFDTVLSRDKVILIPLLPFRLMGGSHLVVQLDEGDVGRAARLTLDADDERHEVEIGILAILHRSLALGARHEIDELARRIHM